jgi:hypothetical protein
MCGMSAEGREHFFVVVYNGRSETQRLLSGLLTLHTPPRFDAYFLCHIQRTKNLRVESIFLFVFYNGRSETKRFLVLIHILAVILTQQNVSSCGYIFSAILTHMS